MPASIEENIRPILITSTGDKVYRTENTIIVYLPPGRRVLSTASAHGGYQTNLEAIYNHQPPHHATNSHELEGGTVEAYLAIVAKRLGLDPEKSAGLITAAHMKHASIITESFRGLEVTAIITAGIEVNGGRAGDPASYYQESGKIEQVGGTINTILLIGADLPEHTLVKALITATEAKTAALQELMAQSRYSSGIATGSGTDGIAIIADTTSKNHLTDAGKHSKLGELIGRTVMKGTIQALDLQSGLNALSQRDIMVRLSRFSITEEDLWKRSTRMEGENRKQPFVTALRDITPEPEMVAAVSSILHIHDEIGWGLIPASAGAEAAIKILTSIPSIIGITFDNELIQLLKREESVLENLMQTMAWIVKKKALDDSKSQ